MTEQHDDQGRRREGVFHRTLTKGERFMQRDPMGYVDGLSLYAYYAAMHRGIDPYGREWYGGPGYPWGDPKYGSVPLLDEDPGFTPEQYDKYGQMAPLVAEVQRYKVNTKTNERQKLETIRLEINPAPCLICHGHDGTGQQWGSPNLNYLPHIPPENQQLWKQQYQHLDKYALRPAVILGVIGAQCVPGVGEGADFYTLTDAEADFADTLLAGMSLGLSAVSGGTTPNYGAIGKLDEIDDAVVVIGRLPDTKVARNWPGHIVLDDPSWTKWRNDAWIDKVVEQRRTVYLASPQTLDNIWDSKNARSTIFGRELDQLMNTHGYRKSGDYLLPPGTR